VMGGPGHMEGHNTHGGVASAAAFAVKQVMQRYNLPGTVAISFGPAEEQLISRPFLVRAGYFKDVDAVLYLHIQDSSQTGYTSYWPDSGYGRVNVSPDRVTVDFVAMGGNVVASYSLP